MATEEAFDRQKKSGAAKGAQKADVQEAYDKVKSKFGPVGGKEKKAAAKKPAKAEYIAEHEVESGDTLSGIALKYYDSAAREKWMAIYEANKVTIGDDPGLIKVGQVLKIPQLD